jgi:PKD repeat protein
MYLAWRCRPFCAAAVAGLALALTFCSDSSSPDLPPQVAFATSCTELSCTFQDESRDTDGAVVGRAWDFGDGSSSSEIAPVHVYGQAGTYSVRLTVVDDSGKSSSSSREVTVSAAEVIFIGAGDIAGCAFGYRDEATAALVDQYPAATVYTLGDNAYPDGSADNYSLCYQPTWGRFKERTSPTPGNHDYHTANAGGYFGYFGAGAGPSERGYYSYDLGAWHIISLDSEIDASSTSAQAVWLEQDLAAHPIACTLAYWHQPLFTSGAVHPPDVAMRPLFTILFDAGAEMVLSGHNHQYERFAPQRPDGTADGVAGVRYFVAGTGGAELYDFATAQPNSEVRFKGYGVLKLTLGAGRYTWQFLPVQGSSFTDSGSGECH